MAGEDGKKKGPARQPRKGDVSWTEDTFRRLRESSPEQLRSRFRLTSGMIGEIRKRFAALREAAAKP